MANENQKEIDNQVEQDVQKKKKNVEMETEIKNLEKQLKKLENDHASLNKQISAKL